MTATRLLRFLTLFAVLFSPISMATGHAAMAMPAPSAAMADHMAAGPAGHCAGMGGEQDKSGPAAPNIDCMIACSAMLAADLEVDVHPVVAAFIEPRALTGALHGLSPEFDPPPPRLS